MAKGMKLLSVVFVFLTVIFAALYGYLTKGFLLSLAITFGTFSYHFLMRLLVGCVVNAVMKNSADCNRRWFRVGEREVRFYERLGVKKWKGRMPTYDPTLFDPKKRSWSEIAEATCQAEVVHEIIILFSFLPLLAAIPFDSFLVFLLTSLAAALFDGIFVILQRYNRPRLLRLASREKVSKEM